MTNGSEPIGTGEGASARGGDFGALNRAPGPLAAIDPAALAGLRALYAALAAELAVLAPRCELSGRCCNFPASGLTLFSTDLELAHLAATASLRADGDESLCPWWEKGLCTARDGRPLGCRVYFCDASKAAELEALSERYHARLKRLHVEFGVSYLYAPFVRRVRELAQMARAAR